ncbi:hypothetical protein BGX28_006958 [Mortierella sp. GBA30]|nr:hypothetical protein BGX28_006958 [Mortierella sp. GBA30]
MSGSVKATLLETNVETVTSVTVEEKVAKLDVSESSSPSTPSKAVAKTILASESHHRELPIFSNPLLANATRANSVPIKPKTGRVKAGGKTVPVLRISAPKVDGEVVVMRRMDSDLVNATSMFNAAYPAISEKMDAKESAFITRKYEGVVEKSGVLSGVWITILQAKELAKEYEIDQFMRPLLEHPNTNSSNPKDFAVDGEEFVERSFVSEVSIIQRSVSKETEESERQTSEEIQNVDETTENLENITVADVVKMKRRIEELEGQASRDKKKFRGLVTVAVGLAAASVIPQPRPPLLQDLDLGQNISSSDNNDNEASNDGDNPTTPGNVADEEERRLKFEKLKNGAARRGVRQDAEYGDVTVRRVLDKAVDKTPKVVIPKSVQDVFKFWQLIYD